VEKISIITVALNEANNIPRLKRSVDNLRVPQGLTTETILVDNGSGDGTANLARSHGYDIVVSLPKANLADCRNAGIGAATGTWLAFIDADCELDSGWLAGFAPLISDTPVLLGWPVRPPQPGTWVQRSWHAHWSQRMPCKFSEVNCCKVVSTDAFRMIGSGNMAFSRSLIKKIGVFNELLHTGEDSEFALRAEINKCHVFGVPAMIVTHHGEPATLRQFYRQQVWHMNSNAYSTGSRATGGRRGLNALYFTIVFGSLFFLAALFIIIAFVMRNWLYSVPALFLPALLMALATRTAFRAKDLALVPALTALYFVYGLARFAKLTGLAHSKKSWRASQMADVSCEAGM
jgi:glycosyltransferase involved in cell wall biosynthesis